MIITQKFGDALLLALHAPGHRLTRCCKGFRQAAHPGSPPAVTRRTANALVNAGLADFNDRIVPSAMTLTDKGVAQAEQIAPAAPMAAAA